MVQVMACCLTAQSHYLSQWSMSNIWLRIHFYTPAPPKVEWGYTWFTPMSVRPSVCRQGFRNFFKKVLAQFISYLAFTLMGWVSWPLHIFVFLASFSALWWPNIWPKMGFPELFEKSFGSIHFIPGIYPYGVSLLTPIHFRVPSLIFGPLVAKYLAKNGVSGTFWKNYWLNSFHTWYLPLWCESLDPYTFSCPQPYFRPSGGQIFGKKWGFRNFLKKLLAQFISYLVFTLMGWVSWPLYIFVCLASFSALWCPNIWPKMGFPELFGKLLAQFISYLAFIRMGWVSWPLYICMFLASFSAFWWPNIWPTAK